MENLFIDTEFNSFGGDLITMAIVDCHGREFYEYQVLPPGIAINLWVVGNVMPVIGKMPVYKEDFQEKLDLFLSHYKEGFKLICDWPDDIIYFCDIISYKNGKMMNLPSFEILLDRNLSSSKSKIPHNALEDAKAICAHYAELYPHGRFTRGMFKNV